MSEKKTYQHTYIQTTCSSKHTRNSCIEMRNNDCNDCNSAYIQFMYVFLNTNQIQCNKIKSNCQQNKSQLLCCARLHVSLNSSPSYIQLISHFQLSGVSSIYIYMVIYRWTCICTNAPKGTAQKNGKPCRKSSQYCRQKLSF